MMYCTLAVEESGQLRKETLTVSGKVAAHAQFLDYLFDKGRVHVAYAETPELARKSLDVMLSSPAGFSALETH